MSFPERLVEARTRAGLTQRALAHRVGCISAQAIAKWEGGATMPRQDVLRKVAAVLDVTPAWLVFDQHNDEILELDREPLLFAMKYSAMAKNKRKIMNSALNDMLDTDLDKMEMIASFISLAVKHSSSSSTP